MRENATIKVGGMFCSNCELKIENTVSKFSGVDSVKASFNKEQVDIVYDPDKVSLEKIEQVISDLDYKILKDESKKFDMQKIYILIIILAVYIILSRFGLLNIFNIFPNVETGMSYGMVFIVGLLTSVHCISMCGGINLSQSVNAVKNGEKILQSNALYNLGRIISYTVIGGIVGLLGSVITLSGVFRGLVAIVAGIFMVIMGVNMLGLFSCLRRFNIRMPKKLAVLLNKSKKGKSSFYIGLLNGFMPCGPLQSMQLYALSTRSFVGGAMSMLLFSLGTVPLMFGFGAISSKLNKKFAEKMLTISAVIIFILGIGMLNNGLSLSGFQINLNKSVASKNMSQVFNDYQVVQMNVDYGSYEPITVKKGIPVKWIINVPEDKLNGCNNEIIVPKYNLDIKLKAGYNLVEFTPYDKGVISYTCWMGMIKSSITVID